MKYNFAYRKLPTEFEVQSDLYQKLKPYYNVRGEMSCHASRKEMTSKGLKTVTKSMKFDLVIYDSCNQPLLIIEVKRTKGAHPSITPSLDKRCKKACEQYKKYTDTGVAVIYCYSNQIDATVSFIKYLIPPI